MSRCSYRLLGLVGLLLVGLWGCQLNPGPRRIQTAARQLQWASLDHDNLTRTFAYYMPPNLPDTPVPLVLLLHGGGQNGHNTWAFEAGQRWKTLADEHQFIVLLPEGQPDPNDPDNHHWNDCRTGVTSPDLTTTADDVGFILALIEWAETTFNIDTQRIYATGASNGGMMTYRLGSEAPATFAALAASIANQPEPSECVAPSQPVPILIMNGTADPLMPFEGGCVASRRCERGSVLSTEETVALWVAANHTAVTPTITSLPDVVAEDGATVERYLYPNDAGKAGVVFYRIENGGHTLPGPTKLGRIGRWVLGPKNQDIDGPAEIWKFFARHPHD